MRVVLFLPLLTLATPALAGPQCTDLPEAQWLTTE